MKDVCIIIPTYNSIQCIDKTLESVFNSKNVSFEVIIVDDCSTDGTYEYLFNSKWENKVTVCQTVSNTGSPNAGRNIGFLMSNSVWVNFLDHDDCITPIKLKSQIELAQKLRVDIVSCDYMNIKSESSNYITTSQKEYFEKNETYFSLINCDGKHKIQPGTLLIKKDICPLFSDGMLDFDWALNLFKNRSSAALNQNGLFRYISGKNLSLTLKYKESNYNLYKNLCDKEPGFNNGIRIMSGIMARNYYFHHNFKKCRNMLLKSYFNYKNIWLYFSSFMPFLRNFTIKKFNILGK